MKKTNLLIIVLPFLLSLLSCPIQAQFTISGEFKMRGEYRDGYLSLRDSSKTPYADILGRARLLFDYKNDKITTRFSLYDAWVFGQNNYSSDTISKNTVNIYEAFFKYNFTKGFGLKIGRTELVYDDERFLGASNWSPWGATHDIILAQWEIPGNNYKGDFGFAVNNIAPATIPYLSSYFLKNYKYMGFVWEQKKFLNDKLTFSFLGVIDAFQRNSKTLPPEYDITYDTLVVKDDSGKIIGYTIDQTITSVTKTINYPDDLYARVTVGLDGWLKLKKWEFFLTGYYQGGHYKDGRKINSWFYAAYLSWQVVKPLKLLVGYDHLSGNDFSNTTKYKTTVTGFSTLYGTSHRGYGYMDLFTAVAKDNLSAGLNDLYARATVTFNDKMYLEGTYRWFSIPFPYLPVSNPKEGEFPYQKVDTKSLGSEIDLMYVYKPIPNLELNAAYCFFLPTATMEKWSKIAPGKSKFANYAYIMVTYKPNFFTSDKK
jgi:hypothetical protein